MARDVPKVTIGSRARQAGAAAAVSRGARAARAAPHARRVTES
jgi:hypothetical protein